MGSLEQHSCLLQLPCRIKRKILEEQNPAKCWLVIIQLVAIVTVSVHGCNAFIDCTTQLQVEFLSNKPLMRKLSSLTPLQSRTRGLVQNPGTGPEPGHQFRFLCAAHLFVFLRQYDYSFRTEHSAAARLPPSPTRTSLSSEA